MVEGRKTWAEIAGRVREKTRITAAGEEIQEALRSALAELTGIEQKICRSEREEFTRWKKERSKWIKGYQRIFRELPYLVKRVKGVVSFLTEDALFCQAPANVQERLRNRKEGLAIVCRMLERLPQRLELIDKIAIDDIKEIKMITLSTRSYLSRVGPVADPQKGHFLKLEEILKEIADREKKVRDENYNVIRKLRLKTEKLKQAVTGFLRDYLIPVIDGLERGIWDEEKLKRSMGHYQSEKELINKWFGAYHQCYGLMRIFHKKIGLHRLKVNQGDEFDPQWHMALGHDFSPELKDNQILEVVRSGWNFNRFPIRSAEVLVVRNDGGKENAR